MSKTKPQKPKARSTSRFHIEFKNAAQKMAWAGFQQHDVLFLSGPAGTGKSFLATAFAINEVLQGNKRRIILTRPIVEAGENLGFLPGDFRDKVDPYMMPLYDCIHQLTGENNPQRDAVNAAIEVAPLAFLRGRTFTNAICILDEAQNATMSQLKLFLTRMGENTKLIINGDPSQSDLGSKHMALSDTIEKLEHIPGVGVIRFKADSIVRHPLIAKIIESLGD